MIVAIKLERVSAIYATTCDDVENGKHVTILEWTVVVDGQSIDLDEERGSELHSVWLKYLDNAKS